jgi:hypothetical protein
MAAACSSIAICANMYNAANISSDSADARPVAEQTDNYVDPYEQASVSEANIEAYGAAPTIEVPLIGLGGGGGGGSSDDRYDEAGS